MKIEELERLAVAATAELMAAQPVTIHELPSERIGVWRSLYQTVLAEFIEQEKAERAAAPKD